jgi:hypothetical protein
MRYLSFLLLVTLSSVAWSEQDNGDELKELLVSAKFSGGCSIIGQMAAFQQTTKMPGGEDFLIRFLSTESARLGMTQQQYMQHCTGANKVYQRYYDAFGKDEGK